MNEETIFATALKKQPGPERHAFLNGACAGNTELKAQVEALLRADSDAGSFLEHPPAGMDPTVVGQIGNEDTVHSGQWAAHLPFLTPCDKPDRIGKLGGYEIIEVVGYGGMGAVLRAFDTKLNRVVAVKVMSPTLAASPTAVKRFLREATTAAAVHHDHVVTIHAVDESHQPPYLVMQFVDGQTLQQKIDREGALELKHILRIGSQAAAGLAAAHKLGLIHRDVKPANILLENGVERVKITDFGLARSADDLQITQTGLIAGTPQYMSPEQAKGEPIDARSDLFSLGSVLYTMCTGRPAFRADNPVAVLRRVCDDTPRPIREVNPEIPEWLEAIVNKLLAKDPADRFQSAAEVADLLSQHLAHVQNPAVAPRPAPVSICRVEKLGSADAAVCREGWPAPPFWLWGTGLSLAVIAMFVSVLKVAFGVDTRTIGTIFIVVMFLFMVNITFWAFAVQLRRMRASLANKIDAKPGQFVSPGVLTQQPVLAAAGILVLLAMVGSAATYMIAAGVYRMLSRAPLAPATVVLDGRARPTNGAEGNAATNGRGQVAAGWQPPENPDPAQIYKEAHEDIRWRRYEVALAKLAWYHENALKYQPSQLGVRLSFAMNTWKNLGDVYPPARDKLKAFRDEAFTNIATGKDVQNSFSDLAAINRTLGEDSMTKDTFAWLHEHNRPEARRAYSIAQPALVKTKEYKLCNDYLDPDETYGRLVFSFRHNKSLANDKRFGPELQRFGENNFANRTATLVALLVVNGRKAEAETIAQNAKQEWNNRSFHSQLAKALKGTVPNPWPY